MAAKRGFVAISAAVEAAESIDYYDPNVIRRAAEIFDDALQTLLEKGNDYGGQWRKAGVPGLIVRAHDKTSRMFSLSQDGKTIMVTDEKLKDTVGDLLNYAVLILIALEEEADEA